MCAPAAVDFSLTPEQLTGLRNEAATATAECCACAFRTDGLHPSTGKLSQLKADGVTPNGQNDSAWTGEIILKADGSTGNVYVLHKLQVVNKTADTTSYPDTVAVADDELNRRVAKIPSEIRRAWNSRPYKLKITDSKCGERTFTVEFTAEMVSSGGHYTVDFVNVAGMGANNDVRGVKSGRSYVLPPNRAKFNLGDSRSATDGGASELEPHEYGHMLGLKDEYHDVGMDRGGVSYTFPDGTAETVGANGQLMGSMGTKTAQPERYCVTVAYAVIALMEGNGFTVTDCVIL